MIRQLPNVLTCCNLAVGTYGVFHLTKYGTIHPLWFVGIAAVFDFLDGFTARLLNARSELGKQLDSLSDLVSFGLVPTMYLMTLMDQWYFVPILVAIFSGIRLAIFNIDTAQEDTFLGLPTPANAIFVTSIGLSGMALSDIAVLVISVGSAFLLVVRIPMLALKFKSWGWKSNELRYTLIFVAVMGTIFLKVAFIPWIIPIYIVLSLIDFLTLKFAGRKSV